MTAPDYAKEARDLLADDLCDVSEGLREHVIARVAAALERKVAAGRAEAAEIARAEADSLQTNFPNATTTIGTLRQVERAILSASTTPDPCSTCGGKRKIFTDGDPPFIEPGVWRDCPACASTTPARKDGMAEYLERFERSPYRDPGGAHGG